MTWIEPGNYPWHYIVSDSGDPTIDGSIVTIFTPTRDEADQESHRHERIVNARLSPVPPEETLWPI